MGIRILNIEPLKKKVKREIKNEELEKKEVDKIIEEIFNKISEARKRFENIKKEYDTFKNNEEKLWKEANEKALQTTYKIGSITGGHVEVEVDEYKLTKMIFERMKQEELKSLAKELEKNYREAIKLLYEVIGIAENYLKPKLFRYLQD